MIDPITLGAAVTTATTCYKTFVSMVQAGKELEDCTATLGKWMGAVSDIDNIHKNSNNPSTFDKLFNGSVQEVAMESFAAKKKVQKQTCCCFGSFGCCRRWPAPACLRLCIRLSHIRFALCGEEVLGGEGPLAIDTRPLVDRLPALRTEHVV